MGTTYTITARPGQWAFINAYDPQPYTHDGRDRFGIVLKDVSLLPEEVANEANVSKKGYVYLSGLQRPAVDHYAGWEFLEAELERMAATNRRKDDLFQGAVIEVTFSMYVLPARPPYGTPLVILPTSLLRIVGYEQPEAGK